MGNQRDGGLLVIGVSERQGTWDLTGIESAHLATYEVDTVKDVVNSYVSPHVEFDLLLVNHNAKNFLAIGIHEFINSPLVCKKNGNEKLEEGNIYVRPPGMARTTKIVNAIQMTDLLQLAAQKGARRILQDAAGVGMKLEIGANPFQEELESEPLPTAAESIVKMPHWEVQFRPITYEKERITPFSELIKTLQSCKTTMRGWVYPYVSDSPQRGPNWITSEIDYSSYKEYCRFYQSAQFWHIYRIQELDFDRTYANFGIIGKKDNSGSPPGFLYIANTIRNIAEIYEFASRLAQKGAYSAQLDVSISLRRIKGFVLAAGIDRGWAQYCEYSGESLSRIHRIGCDQLIAHTDEIAIESAVWFFERFGWQNPSKQMLKDEIASLRAGN